MSTQQSYEVGEIRAHKMIGKTIYYRIHWKGFAEKDNTWEPARNLSGCKQMVAEYWNQQHKMGERVIEKAKRLADAKVSVSKVQDEIRRLKQKQSKESVKKVQSCYTEAIKFLTKYVNSGEAPQEEEPQMAIRTPEEEQVPVQEEQPKHVEEQVPVQATEEVPSQEQEEKSEETLRTVLDPFYFHEEWANIPEDPRITNPITGLPMEFLQDEDFQCETSFEF